ncbi:MAG TPA: hypothetical protein VMW48_20240, partial [Vicinamibacterales bacterium]|nr:hypothetical protein [Vicinamibacterales bacterium]
MTVTATRAAALVLFAAVLGASMGAVRLEGRAPSARDRYEGALALDRDARAAAERGAAGEAQAIKSARRAIVLYESVVRRFPTSGYCDNALMRGGDLAGWIYSRSGRAADRTAAEKYYGWLVREYPTSGLRAQARAAARALVSAEVEPLRRRAAAAPAEPPRAAPPVARHSPASPSAPPVVSVASAPVAAAPPPMLRGIDRAVVNGAVRVTLMLDRETRFSHDVLDGPRRAFVDLFGAEPAADLQDAALRYDG